MKKFLALFITGFFLFLPSFSLAQDCKESCQSIKERIEWYSKMFHGELPPPNNYIVADSINEDLKKGQQNAKAWHSDAYLVNFSYYTDPGSMDDYVFDWVSPSNPTKMCRQRNSALVCEEEKNIYKNPHGIFRVPLTLRKLTKTMLEDKTLFIQLGKLVDIGDNEIKFSLQKSSSNKLIWTITFTNYYAKKSYIVKVDADKIQSPVFNIFASNYVKPYWED